MVEEVPVSPGGARPPDLITRGRPIQVEGLFQTAIMEVMVKLGPTDYFAHEWRTGDGFKVRIEITSG